MAIAAMSSLLEDLSSLSVMRFTILCALDIASLPPMKARWQWWFEDAYFCIVK
jgi:hypothetical protein